MKKKFNIKIFIIIALTILVLAYLIIFNIKKNTKIEVEADITKVGTNYVIATDCNNKEYLLNTSNHYNIGDKINVVMKNVKKGNPYTGEVIKIDTISTTVAFSIKDEVPVKEETSTKEEISTPKEEATTGTDTQSTQPIQTITTEEQLITYLNNFSSEIDASTDLKTNIKEKFITVVDFLFYDGKIGEKTFEELSTTTKLKVLELFLNIDKKIEKKFPNYKENISDNTNKIYTDLKSKAVILYLDITTDVCKNNEDVCIEAKNGLSRLKTSFSLTWDFLKEAAGTGIEKLASWYEIWKKC